ncbi:RDD family protein [Vibrio aquaticus]|uniref:RDD family protein n=1 Tax=Vibrio aquaticus TaxID=2496559 RepID=A0A3S0MG10_9VIBR|nr:RDD family protein [Vibrio aquaticus]RTZ13507.1 RDD family protein [Vibrio aquaticus]
MEEEVSVGSNVELASRWSRFWAVFIDGLIGMAYTVPVLWYTDFGDRIMSSGVWFPLESFLLMIYGWAMYLLFHGYLLHTKGQTIGKNVFDIAIVDTSGDYIGLPQLFTKRFLPIAIAAFIPLVGNYVALIDGLFIFRKDKRCIHDLIAGTKVIALKTSVSSIEEGGEKAC